MIAHKFIQRGLTDTQRHTSNSPESTPPWPRQAVTQERLRKTQSKAQTQAGGAGSAPDQQSLPTFHCRTTNGQLFHPRETTDALSQIDPRRHAFVSVTDTNCRRAESHIQSPSDTPGNEPWTHT